ncbi:benzoate transport [Streptosporangium becharense]|uniref:Benzoate transport n=1 Tax=Streptosporangium becharense TaxID=1816182 RepID=A0A7W9IAP7_9ACTN|nr:MFS transporter [Streptosporangium becharense]MBB2914235.1 benzoate transport [Streptosporangium becharense]MBB5817262.1 benzoate transport [Streptosporangium becharense]
MHSPPAVLRARIDEAPMSRLQWSAIAVCVLLNVLDGFDVLVMSFTSAAVSAEWSLSGSQLGLLLSAGLVGMALGSLLLAPLADRIGRRALILACLGVAAAGMLLSAVSQNAVQLGLLRVLTGIGIGGILASSNVIAAEYANRRWRGLAVSLNSTGYAVGATAGGVIAVALQDSSGWRSVFAFGGVATALLVGAVLWRLPESLDFLLTQRSPRALDRLNALLAMMSQPALGSMPEQSATAEPVPRIRQILSRTQRRNTLLVWAGFFTVMFGFYFVTSWTPKLLVEAGMSATQGITGGVLLNLGGIFGTTLLGLLAARFALKHVLLGYALATAALLAAFVPATSAYALVLTLGVLIGLFVNGCVAGLYALTPSIYPPEVRATGVGWGIGVGRIGAIVSPLVAGWLLDAGWGPGLLYLLVAVVLVTGGLAVRAFRIPTEENR